MLKTKFETNTKTANNIGNPNKIIKFLILNSFLAIILINKYIKANKNKTVNK